MSSLFAFIRGIFFILLGKRKEFSSITQSMYLKLYSFFFRFIYLCIWLCQILAAAHEILLCHSGSFIVAHRLHCSTACRILVPWPGIEPASPALQGEFLTPGLPGKTLQHIFFLIKFAFSTKRLVHSPLCELFAQDYSRRSGFPGSVVLPLYNISLILSSFYFFLLSFKA